MVALLISSCAAAVLGLVSFLPPYLGRSDTIANVPPGLLRIDPGARGIATLGAGVTAEAYLSGIRITRDNHILTETVLRGSPVSAVIGSVARTQSGGRERVTRHLDNVTITRAIIKPAQATYEGVVYDDKVSLPLRIRVELDGKFVRIGFAVKGASALVVHLDAKPATYGLKPGLPDRRLRLHGWWVKFGVGPVRPLFTTVLGTSIAVGPATVPRAMDLSHVGRHDVHVWTPSAVVTILPTPGRVAD